MTIVGLIGGIGSGKSLVASTIARQGGVVIDADRLGHEALRDAAIKARIVERWGAQVLDENGDVQRRALGKIVFADTDALAALEGWVLPYIGRRIDESIAAARSRPDLEWIVLDAPIMLETGWDKVCDRLVFVDAPREQRLARVQARNGWSERDLAQRESRQLPLQAKRARADAVIDNSTTPDAVARQVENSLTGWRGERLSR